MNTTSSTISSRLKGLFLAVCCIFAFSCALTSCSDDNNSDSDNEYSNWEVRNDAYFETIREAALDTMRMAKNQYGNGWPTMCNWRAYLSYSLDSTMTNKSTDSVYVQILQCGTGSGCPLSTDSVRCFYRGRLIPTSGHTDGYVFDHSGQSSKYEDIFNRKISVPTILRPTSAVKGFGTVLQNMHIGDRWRVYVPNNLGYGSTAKTYIPSYSTLVFEIELVSYYRKGASIDPWN